MNQASTKSSTNGIYLYAIAPTNEMLADIPLGIQEQQVNVLTHKGIMLVVSNVIQKKYALKEKIWQHIRLC